MRRMRACSRLKTSSWPESGPHGKMLLRTDAANICEHCFDLDDEIKVSGLLNKR